MDAAMAREAQTEAFDNFENSSYTEANACRKEVKKLDYLDYGEEADDIWELNQMEWLSPKRLAELKEEHKRNPPSQEEEEKVQAFLNLLMEDQERRRKKKSGK